MTQVWAGVDAGKTHHHCVVIDTDGTRLYSQRVANDESALLDLITDVACLTDGEGEVVWAVDLNHGRAVLLIALLVAHEQRLLYIPSRTVHLASESHRGDGKTEARDAMVIADQARMRRDLQQLRVEKEASADSRISTSRQAENAVDRGRAIGRLRAQLLEYIPALEHALDLSRSNAALTLLTRYCTPEAVRPARKSRAQAWLTKRGARSTFLVSEKATAAVTSQYTVVPPR